jgi:formate hydrogenlyase subunit 6/NADH:ubiquinone oxidoreductase subunit I
MCPTPEKAIRLEEAETVNGKGEPVRVKRPVVVRERCIGCGICQQKCPVDSRAAIYVIPWHETRAEG